MTFLTGSHIAVKTLRKQYPRLNPKFSCPNLPHKIWKNPKYLETFAEFITNLLLFLYYKVKAHIDALLYGIFVCIRQTEVYFTRF